MRVIGRGVSRELFSRQSPILLFRSRLGKICGFAEDAGVFSRIPISFCPYEVLAVLRSCVPWQYAKGRAFRWILGNAISHRWLNHSQRQGRTWPLRPGPFRSAPTRGDGGRRRFAFGQSLGSPYIGGGCGQQRRCCERSPSVHRQFLRRKADFNSFYCE